MLHGERAHSTIESKREGRKGEPRLGGRKENKGSGALPLPLPTSPTHYIRRILHPALPPYLAGLEDFLTESTQDRQCRPDLPLFVRICGSKIMHILLPKAKSGFFYCLFMAISKGLGTTLQYHFSRVSSYPAFIPLCTFTKYLPRT